MQGHSQGVWFQTITGWSSSPLILKTFWKHCLHLCVYNSPRGHTIFNTVTCRDDKIYICKTHLDNRELCMCNLLFSVLTGPHLCSFYRGYMGQCHPQLERLGSCFLTLEVFGSIPSMSAKMVAISCVNPLTHVCKSTQETYTSRDA